MKSAVIKRSIVLDGCKTSVSLENEFWDGLREIAALENMTMSAQVRQIDRERDICNLSSAIRVFVFKHFHARFSRHASEGGRKIPTATRTEPFLPAD